MPKSNIHRGDTELSGHQNHSHYHNMISTTSSSLNCSHRPSDANIRYDIDAQLCQSQYTGNPTRVVRTVSMLWAKPTVTTMTSEAAPDFWMRRASSRAISQKFFTATIYSNKGFHRRRVSSAAVVATDFKINC
ncbi:hypothetical protein Taro_009864 [Colocasia esculenta]|uniref:Uncharacterized protein n=1 Tax=Colocasia esculenta TaxID=4460 RepID=A0A843U626_COLES|nr:hypothetical protein [Colocasia esculenta]